MVYMVACSKFQNCFKKDVKQNWFVAFVVYWGGIRTKRVIIIQFTLGCNSIVEAKC